MTTSRDRLLDTLYDMARFEGPVRERLITAYRENATNVREDHLPVDVRPAFKDLHERVTAIESATSGAVEATIRAMTDQEVLDTVDRIYAICVNLLRRDE